MRTFVLQSARLIHSKRTEKIVRIFPLSVALALFLSAALVPVPDLVVRVVPDDLRYKKAARIADAVLEGDVPDPTAGATHFLNATIVRQRRGGSLPLWARGEGLVIGKHTFYAPGNSSGVQQASLSLSAITRTMLMQIAHSSC